MARFGRVLTAMVTPFDERGELDLDAAATLARWLVEEGNEGLVVAGTTGESPTLSIDEKLSLFEAVVGAVDVPVIAGTTGSNTRHDIGLTAEAAKLGVAGILAVCPYYSRPSQAGIDAHMRAIAGTTDLPVVLYDVPGRTGRKIDSELIVSLARDVRNIVALKDAAKDPGTTAAVIHEAPSDFEVYAGDDPMTLPLLAVGAVGAIGVATHWCAPDHVAMFDAWDSGDATEARRVNHRQLESYAFETGDVTPNPIPTKTMLRTLGHEVGDARLPLGPPPEGLDEQAREVYDRLVAARG
ncbi:4-hydroxy-tetrahydrodipicolinate synthase [Ilumatobacter sp.]|uniref:4-hydroxy-tetrahydrodipicolinate synthase n=1 Tax=Ilumatobacter sp. TaxID=1967498 RepID=UPI003B51D766